MATKDSSGSDRVVTVTDDRIRPEGAFAAAGIRPSVSPVWTLAAVAASGIVPGAKRSSPLPTLAAAPLSLTDGATAAADGREAAPSAMSLRPWNCGDADADAQSPQVAALEIRRQRKVLRRSRCLVVP
jgi:hypothetical protein